MRCIKCRKKRPIKARHYYQKSRLKTFLFRFIAVILSLLIFILLIDARVRPIVKNSAASVINVGITQIINKTVIDTLYDISPEYSDIVEVVYGPDGNITHLSLNNAKVNMLKSIISKSITDAVSKDEVRLMRIPWGTLTGMALLSGRGRFINLKITEFSYALIDIRSEFSAAGINQTRHSIILDITIKAHGYVAVTHISTQVKTSLIVAETIIIGDVPNSYFNFQPS